jgi:two-component system, LytTR family, response regulator
MYSCLVVDDNMLERDVMELFLRKVPALQVVAVCENGLDALGVLESESVDIVFSDIEMPELTGISLLKSLKKAPVFVFVSSHSEYALDSYNLDVIDFMVKPVTFERVLKSAQKAIEYIELKRSAATQTLPEHTATRDDHFFIRESNDLVRLQYADVAYIESMGNFSKIFTTADKRHITLVNLKNLEAQLPPAHFTRIHKQYIINHDHISAISAEEIRIADRFVLPLSQSFRQELLEKVVNRNIVTRSTLK